MRKRLTPIGAQPQQNSEIIVVARNLPRWMMESAGAGCGKLIWVRLEIHGVGEGLAFNAVQHDVEAGFKDQGSSADEMEAVEGCGARVGLRSGWLGFIVSCSFVLG